MQGIQCKAKVIKVKQKERSRITKSADTEVLPDFFKALSSVSTEGTLGGKLC